MICRIHLFFSVLIFSSVLCLSQTNTDSISPIRSYKLSKEELINIEKGFKELSAPFSKQSDKKNKYISKEILSIPSYLKALDSNELLINHGELYDYVNSLFEKIVSANQSLLINKNYKLYLYRTSIPNASSLGGGVILVNLGLIANIESEGELVYILCHELSHDINQDVIKGICQDAAFLSDKELNKNVKLAKKRKYGSRNALKELELNYRASITSYSRETELIADSLGLFLFFNTSYNPNESANAIKLLDSIDVKAYKKDIDYKKYFNYKSYPFNESWLIAESETFTTTYGSAPILDELKTHPDCEYRAEELLKHMESNKQFIKHTTRDTSAFPFKINQFNAKIEIVEYLMSTNQYGLALFHCLQYQDESPNNEYLKKAVVNCLLEINYSLKQHQFTSIVDSPDAEYSSSYNQFLIVLNNLRSKDYKAIIDASFAEKIIDDKSVYYNYLVLTNENEIITKENFDHFYTNNNEKEFLNYYTSKLKFKTKIKQ